MHSTEITTGELVPVTPTALVVPRQAESDQHLIDLWLHGRSKHTQRAYGVSPAISFSRDDPDAILSAYVTPVPEVEKDHADERDWRRVRQAVLSVYGG